MVAPMICSAFVRKAIRFISIIGLLCSACAERPFVPVNEGREYGNPKTPFVVSHLPEANQWALARGGHHNVFQKILCFDYSCRKMIGRRKVLKAISFEKLKKQIKKNAKKGEYKKYASTKSISSDTTVVISKEEPVVTDKPVPIVEPPVLKADSLITLSEFLFETNSFKLKTEHFSKLDSIGNFLNSHPTLDVKVSGHTDNTGSERHNVVLSTRRAEVVAEYLIDKGARYERVTFEGFGSADPIADNKTTEGKSKNRRVEILISNPKDK